MAVLKRIAVRFFLALLVLGFLAPTAQAHLDHTFKSLDILEYEEMDQLIRKQFERDKSEDNEDEEISGIIKEVRARKALRILFARRDNDGKRMFFFSYIQNKMAEPLFALALQKVAEESLSALESNNLKSVEKATHLLILENLIAELEPHSKKFKSIFQMHELYFERPIHIL